MGLEAAGHKGGQEMLMCIDRVYACEHHLSIGCETQRGLRQYQFLASKHSLFSNVVCIYSYHTIHMYGIYKCIVMCPSSVRSVLVMQLLPR